MPYANNKDADQPAHPRRLISTFVVRCLVSTIMSVGATPEIKTFLITYVAEQAGLSLTWSQTPKDRFSYDLAHLFVGL